MSFADFPEQEQVVQLLQRSLERGRLAHAYLFTGSRLEELEAVACTLAKTLNCQQPQRSPAGGVALDCCDACLSCRKIGEGTHADVQWVRPESKSRIIKIDQIAERASSNRPLLTTINLKPTEAEFKIGVIVAAERMTEEAANAFLKTLEEPPEKSILILLSSEPQRLPETIVSRCLRLNFADDGRRPFSPDQLSVIQSFSETAAEPQGLLGRYRLLGNLLAKLAEVKTEIETSLSARSPLEKYDDVGAELRDQWEAELTAAIEAEYRHRRTALLAGLHWWLRDVWLQKIVAPGSLESFPQWAGVTRQVAERLSVEDALENLAVLDQTQRLLGTNVQEALALEVGLLKLKL
jgi:DNA polymerase-3 subunit delta'